MHRIRTIVFALSAALALPAVAGAQAPAPGQPPANQPAPKPAPNPDLPAPPANFEYTIDGRRDPFLSLVNRGADPRTSGNQPVKRAEGVPGLLTTEITVRGIVQTRGEYVAMVAGVDGKVYSIRAGDKLADGQVRQVTAQAVVILQEVNDPLSLEKQREVRKLLRGGEEVK
ncbi:MAG TPA: pilus assembly protein PilP [Vicinamibacterales bacterium]|nr:pilus assembly protein PilP [Vicinamibacterales bacterium]